MSSVVVTGVVYAGQKVQVRPILEDVKQRSHDWCKIGSHGKSTIDLRNLDDASAQLRSCAVLSHSVEQGQHPFFTPSVCLGHCNTVSV